LIRRREFLSALTALGFARALQAAPSALGNAASELRQPPRQTILLKSRFLSVTLDSDDGLPYRYEYRGETIWGEDTGAPITAILCRLEPRSYKTVLLKVASLERNPRSAVCTFEVQWEQQAGARFAIRYAIDDASLVITLEGVVEHPGFELIEVALSNLATVREDDRAAWMAQGRDGGSFVRVANAKPYRYPDDDNFGRISTELPMGAVGAGGIACVMEVSAFMDATETSVAAVEGVRRAQIGTIQVHRVHGGRCYEMNDGNDAVCGNRKTPNLLVGQQSRCRLDFYKVEEPQVPWLPAVKLLRERMPHGPTDYFDDKFLFMIAGKQKTEREPRTTLAQSKKLIGEIALLTDYAPQVAFISGWVYEGQDTGYPSEDVVNASLGSYDELMKLMEDGRQLQANVSVNVNYDDAYKSSPIFDPAFIACEPNGSLWKARAWDGEDSYIVGMAKYVLGGWARRRIDAMMARYRLRNAMLIDAMSWFTIRNDWDVKQPASGYKNLVDGKWIVIEEFRKRGVYVTSEKFRYPMAGKLALTVNGPEPAGCPFGGEQVPLTAIVYRKAAIFGGSGDGKLRPRESLFWNSRPGLWFENKTDRKDITDFYFLVVLPYNKVHLLDVERYSVRGTVREICLEEGSTIWMDTTSLSYGVKWNGATITANESTTCPVDAERIAFYSKAGGKLSYPLPAHWSAAELTARRLTVSGREPFPVLVEGGQIVVDIPARAPVMVYARKGAIAPNANKSA